MFLVCWEDRRAQDGKLEVHMFLCTILSVEFHALLFPSRFELGVASGHNANMYIFRFKNRLMRRNVHIFRDRHFDRDDRDHSSGRVPSRSKFGPRKYLCKKVHFFHEERL